MGLFDFIKKEITSNTVFDIKSIAKDVVQNTNNNFVTENGSKIDKELLTNCRYDLSNLLRQDNFYLIQGKDNVSRAIEDVLYLNLYLKEAPNKHPCFPLKQIKASDLCFNKKIVKGTNVHSFISFTPLTKTGKTPKYPYKLRFFVSTELFGEIYYGEYGEIDKAWVVAWHNGICCELNLALINGVLDIKSIYKTNPITYKKQKMYYL